MQEPTGSGVRNDCGVYTGFEVPMNYDPIISKLVTHAEDRESSIQRMVKSLKEYVLLGIKTPIPFLIDVLQSKPFREGDVFTDFIDTHFSEWKPENNDENIAKIAFIVDEMNANRRKKAVSGSKEDAIPSPFLTLGNWRMT